MQRFLLGKNDIDFVLPYYPTFITKTLYIFSDGKAFEYSFNEYNALFNTNLPRIIRLEVKNDIYPFLDPLKTIDKRINQVRDFSVHDLY